MTTRPANPALARFGGLAAVEDKCRGTQPRRGMTMTTDFAKGYMSGYYQGGPLPCGDDDYALGVRQGDADKRAMRAVLRPYQSLAERYQSRAAADAARGRMVEAEATGK